MHVIIPLAFSHIHFNQWIFIYLITPSIFIMQCKKNIIYYIYYNHRHNSCVKSNPKIMGTFVSCVWKKGQENWIFFSNKNGPERGRRIHAQCVQWFLASLHPTPTIYMYILCDVFHSRQYSKLRKSVRVTQSQNVPSSSLSQPVADRQAEAGWRDKLGLGYARAFSAALNTADRGSGYFPVPPKLIFKIFL